MKGNKKGSIYFQLLRLLVFAAFVAALVFGLLNYISDGVINRYYDNSDYEGKKDREIVARMQNHISKNGLTTRDTEALNEWVKRQKIISVQIYKDGVQVFDSSYPNQTFEEEQIIREGYDWEIFYPLEFADGSAEVNIIGIYVYQFYTWAAMMELVFAFGLFLMIVLLGIRNRMNYILQLRDEIEILEGGSLDYGISIKGNDELTVLAEGLDSMRLSFRRLIEREAAIVAENQRAITEMSHDIRTPVTSIMLYTEILRKGNYNNDTQFQEYIEKIDVKAHRLKQLTDYLFNYTLTAGESSVVLEKLEYFETLFYDLLSETCSYLEQRGFQVHSHVRWTNRKTRVAQDYIIRIMDNITSNIIKYADPAEPVVIMSCQQNGMEGFCFNNQVLQLEEEVESTGIGLHSVGNMMIKMGGKCIVEDDGERFGIMLLFPSR